MATEEKLKEDELKEIIRKKKGGRWIEYHGPYKIGSRVRRIRMIGLLLKHDGGWKRKMVRNFTSPIFQT